MYIETTEEVSYNSGIKGSELGKVKGIIESFSWLEDWNVVGVNYRYETLNGTVLQKGGFALVEEQIDGLNSMVEPNLTKTEYRAKERERAYLGFIKQMAESLEIEESKIIIKE
jgi:hypothetical protein